MRLAQILYETSYILSFQKYKLVNRILYKKLIYIIVL